MINKNSAPRPRGRPRAFDRNRALAAATAAFWQLGYEGASIADLTTAMGITPQSLYAAFTSKADLYREALQQYLANAGAFGVRALEEEKDAVIAFERLLREAAAEYTRNDQPRGCMVSIAVSACAVENAPIAAHAAALRAELFDLFRRRIERGIKERHFAAGTDPAALARYVQVILQGISLQARDGAGKAELLAVAAVAAAELRRHGTLGRGKRKS
ncbi:MAG: TetR/AcrR family transcriptional regulator [Nevskia sp.]|nr:TetR/AcrR family transcriptional regulator [Nevskia sp.]